MQKQQLFYEIFIPSCSEHCGNEWEILDNTNTDLEMEIQLNDSFSDILKKLGFTIKNFHNVLKDLEIEKAIVEGNFADEQIFIYDSKTKEPLFLLKRI